MKPVKFYPLHSSPFFKLRCKRKLASLLRSTPKELLKIANKDNYYSFLQKTKTVIAPKDTLKRVQRRLAYWFSKIETPVYLSSAKKGVDYITNAKMHLGKEWLLKLDLKSFYESTQRESVFQCFINTFQQSHDVAWLMTDLVTYDSFLPRGAPTSPIISFWANKIIFDSIDAQAREQELTFSLYVDDMGFSSHSCISRKIISEIQPLLSSGRLALNFKKAKIFRPGEAKLMTGVAYNDRLQVFVPNKLSRKIFTGLKQLKSLPSIQPSLEGQLNAARRLQNNFFPSVRS